VDYGRFIEGKADGEMKEWLHLLAKYSAVPLTVCRLGLAAALLRTSSLHDRARKIDRYGFSPSRERAASCTHVTGQSGGSCPLGDAPAEPMSSVNLPAKGSESVHCAALNYEPGSPYGSLDLLCGLATVLGHEIRAAWNAGDDGLGETLELLLVAVLDTAEVITEEHGA
jgi:hypothetical protein